MICNSENDTRELRTFKRFLVELSAHRQLERTTGSKLPLETATVPREWWNPQGDLPRPKEGVK